jgi:hypothetical protein
MIRLLTAGYAWIFRPSDLGYTEYIPTGGVVLAAFAGFFVIASKGPITAMYMAGLAMITCGWMMLSAHTLVQANANRKSTDAFPEA